MKYKFCTIRINLIKYNVTFSVATEVYYIVYKCKGGCENNDHD